MSDTQRLKLLNAQLTLLYQSLATLRAQNEVLKAQLRQLGRRPATDFCCPSSASGGR